MQVNITHHAVQTGSSDLKPQNHSKNKGCVFKIHSIFLAEQKQASLQFQTRNKLWDTNTIFCSYKILVFISSTVPL